MYNFCMDTQHHTLRCAAYAFVIKEHKILLILRKNTGWMDGKYGLPAGHLEKDETIKNEPEKAEHIKWFDLDSLPENIIPNVEAAIKNYRGKLVFSEFS